MRSSDLTSLKVAEYESCPCIELSTTAKLVRLAAAEAATATELREALFSSRSHVSRSFKTLEDSEARYTRGHRPQLVLLDAWRELAAALDTPIPRRCALKSCAAPADSALSFCAACEQVPCASNRSEL